MTAIGPITFIRSRWGRCAGAILCAALLAACSIDPADVSISTTSTATQPADSQADENGWPVIGPSPGSSHWHAAYLVRICDEVLAPFESTDDPLGIHSHGDGLIHIHPFVESAGFEQATLGVFADAMGFRLGEGSLRLPDGRSFESDDATCDGVPAQVYVDRWADPDPESGPERIFDDLAGLRFDADGELYTISVAPVDAAPVVPPSVELLPRVSALDLEPGEPWLTLPTDASYDSVRVWPVERVTAPPCESGFVAQFIDGEIASCFLSAGPQLSAADAIEQARPVVFNRAPSVELRITPQFRSAIVARFAPGEASVWAIEAGGAVLTAPTFARLPVSPNRVVVTGGMSESSAQALADVLGG